MNLAQLHHDEQALYALQNSFHALVLSESQVPGLLLPRARKFILELWKASSTRVVTPQIHHSTILYYPGWVWKTLLSRASNLQI